MPDTTFSPEGEPTSFPALLERNVRSECPNVPPIGKRNSASGIAEFGRRYRAEVRTFAQRLLALGIEQGVHVAIIGRNRPMLYWSTNASQMVGAIPVPVNQDSVAEEIAYVLGQCGAFRGCRGSGADPRSP